MLSMIEESILRQIREKYSEMEKFNLRNRELEEQIKQLKLEACIWQSKAKHQEAMVKSLRKTILVLLFWFRYGLYLVLYFDYMHPY